MPRKPKQEIPQENGSVEPQNQETNALVNPDIQEDSEEFDFSPTYVADLVLKDTGRGILGIIEPEEKAIPTTQDFKKADPAKKVLTYGGVTYRALTIAERDLLYALYEKYNGNMSQMILDNDCLFKSYVQIRFYSKFYHFHEKLVENRRKKTENILEKLKDAKTIAIERAIALLEQRHRLVYTKTGIQLFDKDGNPLIVEQLPYYKEIKVAWEIIKTELGEATAIAKQDVTSGGKPIQGNQIIFKSFKENEANS